MHAIYEETKLLYLETDASGLGLGVRLLQTKMVKAVQETWHQTTAYSNPSHSQAKVYPAHRDTVT